MRGENLMDNVREMGEKCDKYSSGQRGVVCTSRTRMEAYGNKRRLPFCENKERSLARQISAKKAQLGTTFLIL